MHLFLLLLVIPGCTAVLHNPLPPPAAALAPTSPPYGIIVAFAGSGGVGYSGDGGPATQATLSMSCISHLSLDSVGDVYLADCGNHAIRKIDSRTGVISTIAGTGILGYLGDGSLAINARLNYPSSAVLDPAGNVFIADCQNHVLRKVLASSGVISTIAGTGTNGAGGDGGLAVDAYLSYPMSLVLDGSGNLYFSDFIYNVVRTVSAVTDIISLYGGMYGAAGYSGDGGLATSAQLNLPRGVATDVVGNLFVADTQNHSIRLIDAVTQNISTVAGNGTSGYSGDGALATNGRLNAPTSLTVDGLGNLYISDKGNHVVRRVDGSSGIISTVAGNGNAGYFGDNGLATNAELNAPDGIAIDANNNLYIGDSSNNVIRRVLLPR